MHRDVNLCNDSYNSASGMQEDVYYSLDSWIPAAAVAMEEIKVKRSKSITIQVVCSLSVRQAS